MKRKFRIIIDVLMYIFLITLMGYHITDNLIHEILGTITFILFIIHNILNIKWYKTILKGKHNLKRNLQIAINICLFITMIIMIISGISISSKIFKFLNIKTIATARELHLLGSSWGLILISIHLGFHLVGIMNKLDNKLKKSNFEYVYYLVIIVIVISGIYSFVSLKLWNDMFLINKFKFFNYEENAILFYLKNIAITLSIAYITHSIIKMGGKYFGRKNYRHEVKWHFIKKVD